MKNLILKYNLIISSCMAFIFCNSVFAEPSIYPKEFLKFAKEKNCDLIEDFYKKRPGQVDPPYIFKFSPEPEREEVRAVFWCKQKANARKKNLLIFKFDGSENDMKKCPHVIETDNSPRGLSMVGESYPLSNFHFLYDKGLSIPNDQWTTNYSIKSEYDGVGNIFYCFNGSWLITSFH